MRLRSIIDQFPDMKKPVQETLDGGVHIVLERFDGTASDLDTFLLDHLNKGVEAGRIIIASSFGDEILELDHLGRQGLFLKAIRVVVNAQTKFFGQETFEKDGLNLIALGWEPPNKLWDAQMVGEFETRITQLYAIFGLDLKVIIFQPSRVRPSPEFHAKYL